MRFYIGLASAALGLLTLASCDNYKAKFNDLNENYTKMEREYTVLKEEDKLLRGEYTSTIETLNSIQDTLNNVAQREQKIRSLSRDAESGSISQRQEIINQINNLVAANNTANQNIKNLQSKLNKFNVQNKQLKKMIEEANRKIAAQEEELNLSKRVIEDLNGTLDRLESQLLEKSGELASAYQTLKQEKENVDAANSKLNVTIEDLKKKNNFVSDCGTAYVACGTRKILRKHDIIKELGSGLTKDFKDKVKALNSTINFYENNELSCDEGVVKEVLPARPANSYRIEGKKVIITDSKNFWATDKVVVLVLD
jgi:chromosome segregation ATPase